MRKKLVLIISLMSIFIGGFSQNESSKDLRHKQIVDYSGDEFTFAIMADQIGRASCRERVYCEV